MFLYSAKFLLLLAVLPGLYLAWRVYSMDKMEKEPTGLLLRLFIFGIVSTLPAMLLERIGFSLFDSIYYFSPLLYNLLINFVVIACAEEGSKYFFLKKISWNHPAFNYRFDGIVYAVSVGIGFAIFENIKYVMNYGFFTAIIRAFTAVPAHTIFAIYMGHYYGEAKRRERSGDKAIFQAYLDKAFLVPVLLHGFYDFTASENSRILSLIFWIFLIVLDLRTIKKIKQDAARDLPI